MLAAALLLLVPRAVRADVIYLKNGNRIVGQIIRQDSRQVVYEAGGGEFALPRAIVDHVEIAPLAPRVLPPAEAPAARRSPLPLPAAPPPEPPTAGLSSVIQDGSVDQGQLAILDAAVLRHPTEENRYRLAVGYRQAGSFLAHHGRPQAAIELYRHALNFVPNDLTLTVALGYQLVEQTQYRQALEMLRSAAVQYPRSPDLHILMGSAYYYTEDLTRAIAEWKAALALRDDPQVRLALARAEEEQRIAGSYQQLQSPHFLLRFPDGSAAHADLKPLGEQVLAALDADFLQLEQDLDVYPRQTIVVLLYPDQAFKDITRLPSWVGAVNDGKIRIPVSGLTSLTPQLRRILKHELTHSFVHQATQGRCPVWFNEGLAQLEEGATTASQGTQLSRAFAEGHALPLSALEAPFYKLSAAQAGLAYAESLAALEFIRDRYGMGEIRRLLRRMGTHPNFPSLLEDELRLNYAGLTQAVAGFVEQRYGS